MSILVTGASGFVGRALVEEIVGKGDRIRVLVRRPQEWMHSGSWNAIELWQGDLTQPATLEGIARGIRTVYHLGSEIRDQKSFDAVNRQGTQHLLEQCRAGEVKRFVYVSSVGVMGAAGQEVSLDESALCRPRNEYEASKLAGEQLALGHDDPGGMRVCVLRPSIIYGEGKVHGRDSFLNWLRLIKKRAFVLLGSDYVSSFVYVGDVTGACMALGNDIQAGGEAYIVNVPLPLQSFVAQVCALLNVREPFILPGFAGSLVAAFLNRIGKFASLYNRTTYSMDKLLQAGFQLPYTHTLGLLRTIRWYTQRGML